MITPDEMKSKLTEQLELWNNRRSKFNRLKMDELIEQRMNGMIDISSQYGIINDIEKGRINLYLFW